MISLYAHIVNKYYVKNMRTETLSIRIRKDLKDKISKIKDVDWRREIELFIEKRVREVEISRTLSIIDKALSDVQVSREPAWRTIRELRDRG